MEIHQGTESLKEYRFGSHTIQIFFAESVVPMFTTNRLTQSSDSMRLLHGIDLGTVEVSKGDGKNIHLPPLEEDPL
ncbi:hypothetical protein N7524_011017 [Penicillium chrysogenum]|nr:hypothetical protein N7524_011017 [Penicillium chrysogenum]